MKPRGIVRCNSILKICIERKVSYNQIRDIVNKYLTDREVTEDNQPIITRYQELVERYEEMYPVRRERR